MKRTKMSRMAGWYQTSQPLNSAQFGNSPPTGCTTLGLRDIMSAGITGCKGYVRYPLHPQESRGHLRQRWPREVYMKRLMNARAVARSDPERVTCRYPPTAARKPGSIVFHSGP